MAVLDYQAPQVKRRFPWTLPISLWAGGLVVLLFIFDGVGEAEGVLVSAVGSAIPAVVFLVASWLIYFRTRRVWMHYANIASFILGALNPFAATVAAIMAGNIAAIAAYILFPACFARALTFPEPPCSCPACGGGCDVDEARCPHCKRDLRDAVQMAQATSNEQPNHPPENVS